MRKDIEFRTEDGIVLRGWWYEGNGPGPRPGIVMAHGFSATKEMYLDDFAGLFHSRGFDVLVYDNRNLGESDAPVPGEIDPWQQVRDYRDAITWFSQQDDIDADRIGVWGSSYSGAHVLVVAALDRRVRCVVSQVPLVTGLENGRRLVRSDYWDGLRASFDADRQARLAGEAPAMIPVAFDKASDEPCALPTQDTHDFFFGPIQERATTWRNEVTLRSVELFTEYEPHVYIPRISPTPLLMVVATEDVLTPCDLAIASYENALEPKRLLLLRGGHFDAYVDEAFQISGPAQTQWFTDHLMK
ncbi:alpha/beta hydrolase [Pseudonocardia endophytica]|uniref:AB hydrolase-1 domain-containing protein n=1 Tax=Pseudonocardia endophytica TaxID=401976 RepID=A0A4R1HN21_PSEEN|nr:alpha/beta hydrolase [Pseudonocardia endophytica]TCK21975.1 hypothetical protein EV378_5972 [Pseudonocardia endophytica]